MRCNEEYGSEILNKNQIPKCIKYDGIVRPDIVFYGERINVHFIETAIRFISKSDLLLVLGSSLTVYPACDLLRYAKGNIVIINNESMQYGNKRRYFTYIDENYLGLNIMGIYITGDTHGDYSKFEKFDQVLCAGDLLMVCGDFGFIFHGDQKENHVLDLIEKRPYTVAFVDGNHENFTKINKYPLEIWNGGKIHQIRKNIIHLMRGQVFLIEGLKFYTFGGGYSIDKRFRTENISWWSEEMPSDSEFKEGNENLSKNNYIVDYIITHAAPENVMCVVWPNHAEEQRLNNYLEYVKTSVKHKHWYFGHLHISKTFWKNQTCLYDELVRVD